MAGQRVSQLADAENKSWMFAPGPHQSGAATSSRMRPCPYRADGCLDTEAERRIVCQRGTIPDQVTGIKGVQGELLHQQHYDCIFLGLEQFVGLRYEETEQARWCRCLGPSTVNEVIIIDIHVLKEHAIPRAR